MSLAKTKYFVHIKCHAALLKLKKRCRKKSDNLNNYELFSFIDAPKLTLPVSNTNIMVNIGNKAILPCEINGVPKPDIKWSRKGVILSGDKYYVDRENALR